MRIARGVVLVVLACILIMALGWLGYAAVTWLGYGRLQVDHRIDPLLDHFMPSYDIAERHEIHVAAPASVAYAAACDLDLQKSAIIRAIFRGREVLLGARRGTNAAPSPFLTQALYMGWGVLVEEPGREIVMGSITQPWQSDVVFRPLSPDEFAAFHSNGYVKIIWTLEAESLGDSASVARTVTRVQTTDPESRARFRRYWSVFSPGILLIRREALRMVRDDAERRFLEKGSTTPAYCPETALRQPK